MQENGRRGGRPFRHQMDFRGEDMRVLMNKLKTENPEEYARLQELRKTDKQQFFKELRQHMPKRNNGNGELWKSERECRELVRQIKAAQNEEEREKLVAQLKVKLNENFDLMVSNAQERIDMMTAKLEEIQKNKDLIISERFKSYLAEEFAPTMPPPRGKKGPGVPPPPPKPQNP